MIDKSLRYNYQWGGPGGKSPGASSSGGGGHDRGGQQHQATARAAVQAAKSQPVARSAPDPYRGGEVIVHTPPKTEYITKKEPVAPIVRDPTTMIPQIPKTVAPIVRDPTTMIPQIPKTVAPIVRDPTTMIPQVPEIKDIVDLGDDAKTQQVRIIQKKADYDWANKSTYEKEEQQEKWDAAESKIKLQKEGGFWKSLGNVALAMLVPALLPAKLATAYKLANTVKNASAFAKKIGLTDQDAVQYVKNNILGGKDLSSLVAGKENVIAKSIAQFTGKEDDLSDIEGQIAFKPGSRKDKRLRTLHNQKTEGLVWNEQNQKEYEQLLKEDAEQTEYPKSVTVAHGGRIDRPLMGGSRYI